MSLEDYPIPYERYLSPTECPHDVVELRDEVLTVSDSEKYHVNGIFCSTCQTFIEDSAYSEDTGMSGYKPWRGR